MIAIAQGREGQVEVRREVIGAVAGDGLITQVEQGVGLEPAGVLLGFFQRGLQAGLRQVVGRGVGFDAVDAHGQHRAFVTTQARRFGDVLAHRQVLAGLAHITQRKEFSARAQGSEALLELGVEIEHSGTSLVWGCDVSVLRGGVKRLRGARLGLGGDRYQGRGGAGSAGVCQAGRRCLVGPHRGQARSHRGPG
ncbi:hypothetical protein EMIT0P100_60150 [Pseudomonas sp. IT-P100]